MERPKAFGGKAIDRELNCAIIYIEQFCTQVAFPEGLSELAFRVMSQDFVKKHAYSHALIPKDILEHSGCAITRFAGCVRAIGERVDLKLESDFENIKGSYTESMGQSATDYQLEAVYLPRHEAGDSSGCHYL